VATRSERVEETLASTIGALQLPRNLTGTPSSRVTTHEQASGQSRAHAPTTVVVSPTLQYRMR
jgi:hypothetical protein